jgi:hypothetical protein
MSEAIKSIVSGYVRLKDRKALEILREHRQHALMSLKERSNGWFEVSRLIQQFDEDILAIEEGLRTLYRAPAVLTTLDIQ